MDIAPTEIRKTSKKEALYKLPQDESLGQKDLKTATDKLQNAIKDPEIGIDQVLSVFENEYILNIDLSDYRHPDKEIMLFTGLPKRVFLDEGFSDVVVDLPNADDKRLEGLPKIIKLHLAEDDKGGWGHAQFRKFSEDPRWTRYWELVKKYTEKSSEIEKQHPKTVEAYSGNTDDEKIEVARSVQDRRIAENYTRWLDEIKEKSVGKDLISSGQWLGSGTFLSNIEKMLERGGKLKSAYHVLNSGGKKEDIHGDIKGGDAHKASIFFFHWKHEYSKNNVDTAGRYGTQVSGNVELTDVGIFYPVDTIYKNKLTIGSYLGDKSTSEFFVTKSPQVVTKGKFLPKSEILEIAKNDKTELPLSQAFFRVDSRQKYDEIKELFGRHGYTKDWINDHIYHQKTRNREEIGTWLKSRPYSKAQIPPHESVSYGLNNYLWEPIK
ncbi:hypothetical protein ISR94_00435 [Candidatus Microgenomates bacterium]|nr:hypothetical protein [Candidatus Microgenomates bacterium]